MQKRRPVVADDTDPAGGSRETRTISTGEERTDDTLQQIRDACPETSSKTDAAEDTGPRDGPGADGAEIDATCPARDEVRERDRASEVRGAQDNRCRNL